MKPNRALTILKNSRCQLYRRKEIYNCFFNKRTRAGTIMRLFKHTCKHTYTYTENKRVPALLICLSPFQTMETDNGCPSPHHLRLVQTQANRTGWRTSSSTRSAGPHRPDIPVPHNRLITLSYYNTNKTARQWRRRRGLFVQAPAADQNLEGVLIERELHCRETLEQCSIPLQKGLCKWLDLLSVFCLCWSYNQNIRKMLISFSNSIQNVNLV